jgi:hypothetical protein
MNQPPMLPMITQPPGRRGGKVRDAGEGKPDAKRSLSTNARLVPIAAGLSQREYRQSSPAAAAGDRRRSALRQQKGSGGQYRKHP